jgi:hypothetical protein
MIHTFQWSGETGHCRCNQSTTETQKLAECLTKLQQFEQLIQWFNEDPIPFPTPVPEDRQTAFTRLLIADAAAHLQGWKTVKTALSPDAPNPWGELVFLRYFYQARAARNTAARYLPDRYQHLAPGAQVSDAERAASHPWQRDLLAQLNKKYHW